MTERPETIEAVLNAIWQTGSGNQPMTQLGRLACHTLAAAAIDRAYAIGLAQLPPEIDRLAREWVEAERKWLTWYGPDLELRRLGDNRARARNKLLHALHAMVTP